MVHRFLYIPATRAESDLNLNSFCQFNPGWKSSCSTFPDKGINLWRRPPAPRPRVCIFKPKGWFCHVGFCRTHNYANCW
ncbi:hypothetical protein Hdeb2414_s0113g00798931 [Helianthus debilis subsp. tardiflorus]